MEKLVRQQKDQIVIYQGKNGALEFRGDFEKETIWANQAQMVDLFNIDQSVISKHIRNIFRDREVDLKSNMQKMHNANSDKPILFYSLDVVLSVGYRTNSNIAIDFRKWATKTLRQHILEGYTLNRKRLNKNYQAFLQAVDDVKKFLPLSSELKTGSILELIKIFASTWLSLDSYDKMSFPKSGNIKKQVEINSDELNIALGELKIELVKKGEASELFGQDKQKDSIKGIVGNVFQSFGGKDVYPTFEEKASHLLYFIVKNHPFTDGNKRSGAFAFIWFLQKAKMLNVSKLTPEALTTLTLLVAESNPKDKDKITGLILMLL